jgi:hypothetical protein
MARTRELIRDLKQELAQDAGNSPIVHEHRCDPYIRDYGTCLLCALCSNRYSLALMLFIDLVELRAPEDPLFPSEAVLLNILGQEKFERAAQAQLDQFFSGPSKQCANCQREAKVWGGAQEFIRRHRPNQEYRINCPHCGVMITFEKQEVHKLVRKRKPSGTSLPAPELEMNPTRPRERRRARRREARRRERGREEPELIPLQIPNNAPRGQRFVRAVEAEEQRLTLRRRLEELEAIYDDPEPDRWIDAPREEDDGPR